MRIWIGLFAMALIGLAAGLGAGALAFPKRPVVYPATVLSRALTRAYEGDSSD